MSENDIETNIKAVQTILEELNIMCGRTARQKVDAVARLAGIKAEREAYEKAHEESCGPDFNPYTLENIQSAEEKIRDTAKTHQIWENARRFLTEKILKALTTN